MLWKLAETFFSVGYYCLNDVYGTFPFCEGSNEAFHHVECEFVLPHYATDLGSVPGLNGERRTMLW